jgi:hypothetical protein
VIRVYKLEFTCSILYIIWAIQGVIPYISEGFSGPGSGLEIILLLNDYMLVLRVI